MKKILLALLLLAAIKTIAQTEESFDIKIGTDIPIIKFGEIYKPGVTISLGYLFFIDEQTKFTIHTGYYNIPFDNEKYNLKYADFENGERFNFKAPLTAIPLTIGIRYYLTDKNVKPYVVADAGFYYYTQKLTGSYIQDGKTYSAPPLEKSAFSTTFTAGFGLTYPLSEIIILDIVGKFNGFINANAVNSTGSNTSARSASSTLYNISLLAGINYQIK